MQPLHKGLSSIPLYSTKNMKKVNICLDSGMLATDSCYRDVRTADGLSRVETVWVNKEDAPTAYCNKHLTMDYCTEGHGAANEYCRLFAQHKETLVEKKALLKLTTKEKERIFAAAGKGLNEVYLRQDYMCHAENGQPYVTCKLHTRQSWENFLSSQQPDPEPTEPTKPAEPTQPQPTETTKPPEPTATAEPTEATNPPEPTATAQSTEAEGNTNPEEE